MTKKQATASGTSMPAYRANFIADKLAEAGADKRNRENSHEQRAASNKIFLKAHLVARRIAAVESHCWQMYDKEAKKAKPKPPPPPPVSELVASQEEKACGRCHTEKHGRWHPQT